MKTLQYMFVSIAVLSLAGCRVQRTPEAVAQRPQVLKTFAVDDLKGLRCSRNFGVDSEVSYDGNGSLKLEADQSMTFELYQTGDLDVEDALLWYRAMVRCENLTGRAYLEMWVQMPDKSKYFSRDLMTPLTGTSDWSKESTPFRLEAGQNPDNIFLNLVVEGTGTVWIDAIQVDSAPLPKMD